MVAYNKHVRIQNGNKIATVLERLQTKLLELDDKVRKLDVNLEKILFLKNMKEDLEKRIRRYEIFSGKDPVLLSFFDGRMLAGYWELKKNLSVVF